MAKQILRIGIMPKKDYKKRTIAKLKKIKYIDKNKNEDKLKPNNNNLNHTEGNKTHNTNDNTILKQVDALAQVRIGHVQNIFEDRNQYLVVKFQYTLR